MDKSIVINFENIEYTIWFSENLRLLCNKKVGGVFVSGIDQNDKSIIREAINSLCVSKDNSYFIKSDSFNGVPYNLFYDYSKFLYFSDSLDDSVNSFINSKYNNMPLVYSSSSDENDKFRTVINITRQVGKCLVSFGIGLSVSFLVFSLATKLVSNPDLREKIIKCIVSEVPNTLEVSGELTFNEVNFQNSNFIGNDNIDYSNVSYVNNDKCDVTFDQIKDALQKNPNVDDGFKDFFSKLDFALEDDLKYFDSSIVDKFGSLSVEYITGSPIGDYVNGQYYPGDNKIIYYDVNSFSEVDPNTALHELGHVFQSVKTNNICFELSNEVWTRETLKAMVDRGLMSSDLFSKDERGNIVYVDGYADKLFLYYYLMELMPTDSIKKFQWDSSDYNLISSFADMDNQYEVSLAHEILDLINDSRNVQFLRPDDKNVIKLKGKLDYFYNKKYGYDLDKDINLFAFDYISTNVSNYELNKLLINDSTLLDSYDCEKVYYYGLAKSYFTDNYDTRIYYSLSSDGLNRQFFEIPVDDNLRVEFSEYNQSSFEK